MCPREKSSREEEVAGMLLRRRQQGVGRKSVGEKPPPSKGAWEHLGEAQKVARDVEERAKSLRTGEYLRKQRRYAEMLKREVARREEERKAGDAVEAKRERVRDSVGRMSAEFNREGFVGVLTKSEEMGAEKLADASVRLNEVLEANIARVLFERVRGGQTGATYLRLEEGIGRLEGSQEEKERKWAESKARIVMRKLGDKRLAVGEHGPRLVVGLQETGLSEEQALRAVVYAGVNAAKTVAPELFGIKFPREQQAVFERKVGDPTDGIFEDVQYGQVDVVANKLGELFTGKRAEMANVVLHPLG